MSFSSSIRLERRGSEVHEEQLDALVTKVRLGVIGVSFATSFNQHGGNHSTHTFQSVDFVVGESRSSWEGLSISRQTW